MPPKADKSNQSSGAKGVAKRPRQLAITYLRLSGNSHCRKRPLCRSAAWTAINGTPPATAGKLRAFPTGRKPFEFPDSLTYPERPALRVRACTLSYRACEFRGEKLPARAYRCRIAG
jgi:hypothetical protein